MKKILIAMTLSFLGYARLSYSYPVFYSTMCPKVTCHRKNGCMKDGITYKNGQTFTDFTSPTYPTCQAVRSYWYHDPCQVTCHMKNGCMKDGITYKNGKTFTDFTSKAYPTCDDIKKYWTDSK